MALSDKQEMFVNEYLKCFNATKAAKAAGYSEATANEQGSRLLANVNIASRIRERLKEAAMEADEVLFHLAEIARGDMDTLVDNNGNPDIVSARANGKTRLIKKIKQRSITTEESDITESEIETHDRLRALELLGKHYKLFTDKIETSGEVEVVITDAKQRLEHLLSRQITEGTTASDPKPTD
jgi:phage terminase small subunit